MSQSEACRKCSERYNKLFDPYRGRHVELCEAFRSGRKRYAHLTRVDRSYRAHLSGRVLRVPCDITSHCQEMPHGHALFGVEDVQRNSDFGGDFFDAYEDIIGLALN
jgi:hypothetical protein